MSKLTASDLPRERAKVRNRQRGRPSDSEVERVIAAQDDRGAWVEDGRLRYHGGGDDTRQIIDSQTFIKNLDTLSRSEWLARLTDAAEKAADEGDYEMSIVGLGMRLSF